MTPRQVTINLSDEDMIQIAEEIGSWEKLWHAIGYLSTWSIGSYPYVNIWREPNSPDLVATYRDTERDKSYTIGAVWHEDHYGFHS